MNDNLYVSIRSMVEAERDAERRSRLEQFVYAAVCSWNTFSIHQAAQAAIQLANRVHVYDLSNYQSVLKLAQRLDIRSDLEWLVYGFAPKKDALPVLLSGHGDTWSEPQAFYLRRDVIDPITGAVPSPHSERFPEHTNTKAFWASRLGKKTAPEDMRYEGFHETYDYRAATMLGNLWKIGAIATWEKARSDAASWAELPYPPGAGDIPQRWVNEENAWYHFRISHAMGRDAFAEIALCLGNVYCHHVPQVWRENSVRGIIKDCFGISLEAEASGSIAIARLHAPRRRGASFFGDNLIDDATPLPSTFRLDMVLKAASEIQDLLQGDTLPITGAAWFTADDTQSN